MSLIPRTVYLPNKFSTDLVDYSVDFTDFVPKGFQLDEVDVEVILSGTGESPLELEVHGEPTVGTNRAGKASLCLFWLNGGTPMTRYRLKLTASDDQHTDPDRSYSVYAEVYVTG